MRVGAQRHPGVLSPVPVCPPRPSRRLLIGAEAVLRLRANASNVGEGAFEAELRVQLPPGTHYQAARSNIPVGARQWGSQGAPGVGVGLTPCPWWPSPSMWVPGGDGCQGVQRVEGLTPCPWTTQVPGVVGARRGSMMCHTPPPPCVHPIGAGEAELQPQEGEWDPCGALRVGQPHESGCPGKGMWVRPSCAHHPGVRAGHGPWQWWLVTHSPSCCLPRSPWTWS